MKDWEIPASVVNIVKALVADYDRRSRAINRASQLCAAIATYTELNAVIDEALCGIEEGIRSELLEDIKRGRGYDASATSSFIAKNTYYQRKRKLIYDIAKGLSLIP